MCIIFTLNRISVKNTLITFYKMFEVITFLPTIITQMKCLSMSIEDPQPYFLLNG